MRKSLKGSTVSFWPSWPRHSSRSCGLKLRTRCLSDESSTVRVGRSPLSGAKSAGGGGTGSEVGATSVGQREGEVGNIYHLFEKKGGVPSDKSAGDPFPTVEWVSVENGGRHAGDQLEDKAATFISTQNTLLGNGDFRGFKDMVGPLCKGKGAGAGPRLSD